jgi:hypothetical protein
MGWSARVESDSLTANAKLAADEPCDDDHTGCALLPGPDSLQILRFGSFIPVWMPSRRGRHGTGLAGRVCVLLLGGQCHQTSGEEVPMRLFRLN